MVEKFATLLEVDLVCFHQSSRDLVSVAVNHGEAIVQLLLLDCERSDVAVEFDYA